MAIEAINRTINYAATKTPGGVGGKQLFLILVLASLYTGVTAMGISLFNDCESIQNSEMWKNIKMYLSHTLTIGIMIPVVLLMQKVMKKKGWSIGMLYAIMALIGSAMILGMAQSDECKSKDDKQHVRNVGIAGLVISIVMAGGIGMVMKSSKKYRPGLKGAVNATV
jgi:peptidoglycan biosynthesis protein MviN/MurJ (putative lipid II flippase)